MPSRRKNENHQLKTDEQQCHLKCNSWTATEGDHVITVLCTSIIEASNEGVLLHILINYSTSRRDAHSEAARLRFLKQAVALQWRHNEAMASQITSLTIVYSGADQRKHQSSASLAFLWGIHRWPVNFPHKVPVTRKISPFEDVIMDNTHLSIEFFYHRAALYLQCHAWLATDEFASHSKTLPNLPQIARGITWFSRLPKNKLKKCVSTRLKIQIESQNHSFMNIYIYMNTY